MVTAEVLQIHRTESESRCLNFKLTYRKLVSHEETVLILIYSLLLQAYNYYFSINMY